MATQNPITVNQIVNPITVTVKLFAAYQEAYGVPELILEFPVGTTVKGVCDRLLTEHPELEVWRTLTRFGVNLQFVDQILSWKRETKSSSFHLLAVAKIGTKPVNSILKPVLPLPSSPGGCPIDDTPPRSAKFHPLSPNPHPT
jgi:sulfur-carrier protein